MKKNKNLPAFVLVSLLIGYLFGGLVGIPGVDSSLLSGDVSKVNSSTGSKAPLSEEAQAFQERMEKDANFREETMASLAIIDERVDQFNNLTHATADAAKGIKELNASVAQITDMQKFAEDAKLQADSALIMLCNMANGTKEVGADYEQLAKNTFIAYTLMDSQKEVAREFVEQVDKYLFNNSKNEALLKVRNKWVAFCGDGAALNGNKAETAYWDKKAAETVAGAPQAKKEFGIALNLTRSDSQKSLAHASKIMGSNGVSASQLNQGLKELDKRDISANILMK